MDADRTSEKLQKIIDTFNKNQPTYKRISALDIRKEPFEKSSTKRSKEISYNNRLTRIIVVTLLY